MDIIGCLSSLLALGVPLLIVVWYDRRAMKSGNGTTTHQR